VAGGLVGDRGNAYEPKLSKDEDLRVAGRVLAGNVMSQVVDSKRKVGGRA
jgi:hypothetical protein